MSQAEIGVWVEAPGRFYGGRGISPLKNVSDCIRKILQSSAFWPENGSKCHPQCVLKHFNSGKGVLMRSVFSIMGTAYPHVPSRSATAISQIRVAFEGRGSQEMPPSFAFIFTHVS